MSPPDAGASGTQVVSQPAVIDRIVDYDEVFVSTVELPILASGIVTSVPEIGDSLVPGDAVVSVDGVPVVLLEGSTPAYRSMGLGDSGADVESLQRFLVGGGFSTAPVNGQFGSSTQVAVREWRTGLGFADGERDMVNLGEVVFVSQSPPWIVTASGFRAGWPVAAAAGPTVVSDGRRALRVFDNDPRDGVVFFTNDGRPLAILDAVSGEGGGVSYFLVLSDGSVPSRKVLVTRREVLFESAVIVPILAVRRDATAGLFVWCRPTNSAVDWTRCAIDVGPVLGTRVVVLDGLVETEEEIMVPQ